MNLSEQAKIYRLEHDPDVIEFYDQPEAIKLSYHTKEGRRTGCFHTPDFFVLRRNIAGWEECQPEDKLFKLAEEMPNRYVWTGTNDWDCPPSGMCYPLCGKTGIRLVAFIDAADVLHMIGVGPMPGDSS